MNNTYNMLKRTQYSDKFSLIEHIGLFIFFAKYQDTFSNPFTNIWKKIEQ